MNIRYVIILKTLFRGSNLEVEVTKAEFEEAKRLDKLRLAYTSFTYIEGNSKITMPTSNIKTFIEVEKLTEKNQGLSDEEV